MNLRGRACITLEQQDTKRKRGICRTRITTLGENGIQPSSPTSKTTKTCTPKYEAAGENSITPRACERDGSPWRSTNQYRRCSEEKGGGRLARRCRGNQNLHARNVRLQSGTSIAQKLIASALTTKLTAVTIPGNCPRVRTISKADEQSNDSQTRGHRVEQGASKMLRNLLTETECTEWK